MISFERWLQSRLAAHGFPTGLIDGIIGPITIAALRAFQQAKRLPVNGIADPETVEALRASSSWVPDEIRAQIPDRDEEGPEEFQPSNIVWPRQKDCMAFYGDVGTNQTSIEIPFDMYLSWSKTTRLRRMTIHEKVADTALAALERISEAYSAKERTSLGIDLFGGSLNVRRMRGGTNYSMHSWGIAIDFDPERNGLHVKKPQARLSHPDAIPFWLAWEAKGWLSLGRARNMDWMHVQAARL